MIAVRGEQGGFMRGVAGQLDSVINRGPRDRRRGWHRRAATGATTAVASLLLAAGLTPAASAGILSTSAYIVATPGTVGTVLAATDVLSVGGQVVQTLPAADGVEANLTSVELPALSALPGVVVTPDVSVSVQGLPAGSTHSPSDAFLQQTGAKLAWSQGDKGAGVNVAVLDTGIDPLADFAGRLVGGFDLSGEGNAFHDSYGHGTFDAGLIAGNGASSKGTYEGEAPGAGLVAVKVAGASGTTDLATVIAGVGWTIDHRAALGIRVLNMSLGYQPLESTAIDPLDTAVENAWQSGIVVVVSAGNAGPFNGTILSPGDDPLVVTVGALDDRAQPAVPQDVMAPFSSVGPTNPDGWFKPDLVTSGRSVVSLAAPGSTIYNAHPSAIIGTGNFVGSGTSFSTAVTSGAAALLLQAQPALTPNQVKAALLAGTNPGPVGNPAVDGHGALDAYNSLKDSPLTLTQKPSAVAAPMGALVALSTTWALSSWNPANWSSTAWNTSQGGSPNPTWSGTAWDGTAWDGTAWDGTAWDGTAWDGTAWDGTAWDGTAWDGTAWDGTAWDGSAWD
jgi:serine protease AprX